MLTILLLIAQFACGSDTSLDPAPEQTPDHTMGDLVIDLPGNVKMAFIHIRAGTFMMGFSQGDTWSEKDEAPRHQVTLTKDFYLGKYEVTRAQWISVLGANVLLEMPDYAQGSDYPVSNITWAQCQIFVQALSKFDGSAFYRLPTEAEWEYACRAGKTTAWFFGNQATIPNPASDFMWYTINSGDQLQKVGLKQPNPWGLYDMHGNLAEWVQDFYSLYSSEPQRDPVQLESYNPEDARVRRGGSYSDLNRTRSASRSPVHHASPWAGFRIVREKP